MHAELSARTIKEAVIVHGLYHPNHLRPLQLARYPTRIPPELQELLSQTEAVLAALREALAGHMLSGTRTLRAQAIRMYRLLERSPAVRVLCAWTVVHSTWCACPTVRMSNGQESIDTRDDEGKRSRSCLQRPR